MSSIKFLTAIYSDLYGTEYGGRPNRYDHYRFSLLSLLKMTNATFLCYTSDREIQSLRDFFYRDHNISENLLEFKVFDISKTKFSEIINRCKNVENTKKSDRCIEIQYSKFHWYHDELKDYDYYYWIDSGLSHCGLIPLKYLNNSELIRRYYESPIFDNKFLQNLIDFTQDEFFLIAKDNVRNYWSGTVDPKWYTNYDMSRHVIGGLFGGRKEMWDTIVPMFENYLYNIIEDNCSLPYEENVMSLMFYNHPELFKPKYFDVWWCSDNCPQGLPDNFFEINKSFYTVLEEIMNFKV